MHSDSCLSALSDNIFGFIVQLMPGTGVVDDALSGIGAATWYFLDVFQIQAGIAMMVSAYATRFIIRRMPIIG